MMYTMLGNVTCGIHEVR